MSLRFSNFGGRIRPLRPRFFHSFAGTVLAASGGTMAVVIRIFLVFLFIQLLVLTVIMSVGLILARADVPVWRHEGGRQPGKRTLATVIHLPGRFLRSVLRRVIPTHTSIC